MAARSYPTWIITQQSNEVPVRKGPFHDNKFVEAFLREAYRLYPAIICIVVDGPVDNTWWPQHGYEWLDINGDGRKRHPRKDRPSSPSPQPNLMASSGDDNVPQSASEEAWQSDQPINGSNSNRSTSPPISSRVCGPSLKYGTDVQTEASTSTASTTSFQSPTSRPLAPSLSRPTATENGPAPQPNVAGRWLPIEQADKTINHVTEFTQIGLTLKNSDTFWVRDEDGRVYEAAWSEGNNGRDYWWDWEGESPVDPVEFMPHPLDPRFGTTEGSTDE